MFNKIELYEFTEEEIPRGENGKGYGALRKADKNC